MEWVNDWWVGEFDGVIYNELLDALFDELWWSMWIDDNEVSMIIRNCDNKWTMMIRNNNNVWNWELV